MMNSSRTPEGQPSRCPICGSEFKIEPSRPAGDALCPNCGHLRWVARGSSTFSMVPGMGGLRARRCKGLGWTATRESKLDRVFRMLILFFGLMAMFAIYLPREALSPEANCLVDNTYIYPMYFAFRTAIIYSILYRLAQDDEELTKR